jgi:hypothetical protein
MNDPVGTRDYALRAWARLTDFFVTRLKDVFAQSHRESFKSYSETG